MKTDFATAIENIKAATLNGPGQTDAVVRQDIANYTAQLTPEHTPENGRFPKTVRPYINKVGLYAYKTTDKDIQHLKEQAFTEEEIFEMTLAAAFGAGIARLENGLALLEND